MARTDEWISVRQGPRRVLSGCAYVLAFISIATAGSIARGESPAVQTRHATITIPTYPWGPDDVNPHFPVTHGRPIYPYPMQDNLARTKEDRTYDTLVLENEYLRVTVIPELGGHVHSVFDKAANREMFYVNKVVKPGLIGMRGAWISGGIEFNTGPQGHTVTCVSPLSCRFVEHDDGSRSIAIGTIERVFRTQWVVVVTLRPGRKFLEERIRIFNPTPYVQPYYFWNCTAVPNTDGMRFMYPMTLGTDHAGTTFFRWPVNKGVDLSWSKNYRKPSSIFAYQCDQDFFGSYDYDVDHGVVAYANHFDLPGKKAWTWGRGGEGVRAMGTLTDDGSFYNEVQTGPLRTQADYGLLQPNQTVEWREWWYPVHGIGGYEFATRDVAVNVIMPQDMGELAVRVIGTGTWENADIRILREGREAASKQISISPKKPTTVSFPGMVAPVGIEIAAGGRTLASFTYPLPLPKREQPGKLLEGLSGALKSKAARDHWASGVLADKQSKPDSARAHFLEALKKDPGFAPAHLCLAVLDLESGLPQPAKIHAETILKSNPDNGLAHYYLARAMLNLGDDAGALEQAWKAARDPASDSIGLALAGEIYMRGQRWDEAIGALQRAIEKDGQNIFARDLLILALRLAGRRDESRSVAHDVFRRDPLDPIAGLALIGRGGETGDSVFDPLQRVRKEPQTALEVAAVCYRLKAYKSGLELLRLASSPPEGSATPISYYYTAVFADFLDQTDVAQAALDKAAAMSPDRVFPDRLETVDVLKHAAHLRPNDWRIPYYLGCLYLAHYRTDEAVEAWKKALELGGDYSVIHRNLAVVSWKLEDDDKTAIAEFEKAIALRPDDLTLYRDLGALYRKSNEWAKIRDLLEKTLEFDRYRSDVVELLARAYHNLDEDEKTAALIDSRTFDAWEGQRSLYDIYKDAHMALGKKALEAKEYDKAAAEFARSLEYPSNLGVGRPENVKEAEQYFLLGKARNGAGKKDGAIEAWKRAAAEGEKKPSKYATEAAEMLEKISKE